MAQLSLFKSICFCLSLIVIGSVDVHAQNSFVDWTVQKIDQDGDILIVEITATLNKGWMLYSQHTAQGGPIPTSFNFNTTEAFELIGGVEESDNVITEISDMFGMEVSSFKDRAVFSQKLKVLNSGTAFSGEVRFMLCNHEKCLPPRVESFSIIL